MKKRTQLTNLIILDASGSMQSKVNEVRGGLKQLLQQIKDDAIEDSKKVKTGTIIVDFSSHDDFRVLVNTTDSATLQPEMANDYETRAMTALYDAINKAFALVPGKQDSVFVTIFTDGQENDSKEAKHSMIQDLIKLKKENKWVITFMGTSEADINNAVSLGISRGNTMAFSNDAAGVKGSMQTLSSVRSAYYCSNTTADSNVDMDNLIKDNKKPKK